MGEGHAIVRSKHVQLCWSNGKVLMVPCDPQHNLSIVQATCKKEQQDSISALAMWVLDEQNQNLHPAQKELLKWHFHLGHLSFRWLQQLVRKPNIGLPNKIANCDEPLYAACQFGKAKCQPVPWSDVPVLIVDSNEAGAIANKDLEPGACVSIDQYITQVHGCLWSSRGKKLLAIYTKEA